MSAFADAPRAGSAEAKSPQPCCIQASLDAPRAGSAEAKRVNLIVAQHGGKDAPRAGSAEAKCKYSIGTVLIAVMHPVQAAPRQREDCQQSEPRERRCTPCRQRRGKVQSLREEDRRNRDAPRAGSAEAKIKDCTNWSTPSRMHPVQAAPRQSVCTEALLSSSWMHPVQAAPRQSASKKGETPCTP